MNNVMPQTKYEDVIDIKALNYERAIFMNEATGVSCIHALNYERPVFWICIRPTTRQRASVVFTH